MAQLQGQLAAVQGQPAKRTTARVAEEEGEEDEGEGEDEQPPLPAGVHADVFGVWPAAPHERLRQTVHAVQAAVQDGVGQPAPSAAQPHLRRPPLPDCFGSTRVYVGADLQLPKRCHTCPRRAAATVLGVRAVATIALSFVCCHWPLMQLRVGDECSPGELHVRQVCLVRLLGLGSALAGAAATFHGTLLPAGMLWTAVKCYCLDAVVVEELNAQHQGRSILADPSSVHRLQVTRAHPTCGAAPPVGAHCTSAQPTTSQPAFPVVRNLAPGQPSACRRAA